MNNSESIVKILKLPQRLRDLRGKRTQQQMAELIGVSQASYAQWENGRRHENLYKFANLCRSLNVSADWLLGLVEERKNLRVEGEIANLRSHADEMVGLATEMRRRLAVLEKGMR